MTTSFETARGYLVECFLPGVDRTAVELAADRSRRAASELCAAGTAVRYVGALLVPRDEVVLHLFRAESSAAVRDASHRAALTFERVVDAITVVGYGPRTRAGGAGP
jgi:hypothetical protein